MNATTAGRIYDILIAHVGALDSGREAFVRAQTDGDCTEYRFRGMLGLGGKFWIDPAWRVTCYPEDASVARLSAMVDCNHALKQLQLESP